MLMGFPHDWRLPTGVRRAQRAVGNAVRATRAALATPPLARPPSALPFGTPQVPPPFARAVMEAAWRVAHARHHGGVPPLPTPPPDTPALPPPSPLEGDDPNELRRKLQRLEQRLDVLETVAAA